MVEKTNENTSFVVNENKRANSKEFGKPGNRFKIYFEDAEDLKRQIDDLKSKGLYGKPKNRFKTMKRLSDDLKSKGLLKLK